jgi:hypothetical protein|tara:strand:+ start:325 stop:543 length:219 start_codon:yes stop_codon:yes gene_type:complete
MRFCLPVPESKFIMYVDFVGTPTKKNRTTLTLAGGNDRLTSMKYFSGDGTIQTLGEYDNFNVGYKTTLDCSN